MNRLETDDFVACFTVLMSMTMTIFLVVIMMNYCYCYFLLSLLFRPPLFCSGPLASLLRGLLGPPWTRPSLNPSFRVRLPSVWVEPGPCLVPLLDMSGTWTTSIVNKVAVEEFLV